ncbi:MAG: C69 family dipeptidase [Oscillospiraceae bacterium]|nr:C69 family dipeptidase [Oscillospiraceae bacterium]
MACTTILVGKKASYDGSTMIARNDDSGSGHFTSKKFVTISPEEQPAVYKSVLSHVEIKLPQNPMRFTAVPNAVEGEGIWAASGVNEENVGMTATETITSNSRVLGADPLVEYQPAQSGQHETVGGIGEEDIVYIVLPYIHSAREGVERLGGLLEKYGTYEMNGIAFQDINEIWWLETIGGHHWIARKVPDDVYVVMPNQLGIDQFDLEDALTEKKNYMCSADLGQFIEKNHLDLSQDGRLNPRDAFGSHDDADHVYNTPRAWFMLRYFNPRTKVWDGPNAEFTPFSDDLPWCMVPEKKIAPEDVKYALSSHYQGTPYDPYEGHGSPEQKGIFRPIGINRNDFVALIQLRPDVSAEFCAVEWLAFASNAFNTMVPFYANIHTTPAYLANTTQEVSTDNFYWCSRMIAAMADASYGKSVFHIERYQLAVQSKGNALIDQYDDKLRQETDSAKRAALREEGNQKIADMLKEETADTLGKVLFELSSQMKNAYSRSDA